MSFDLFGGGKKTSSRVSQQDQRIGAADYASVFAPRVSAGNKSRIQTAIASNGGIAIEGEGNTLTLNTTDHGALQIAGDILGRTLDSQASLTLGALDRSALLAETKVTDGANLSMKSNQTILLALGALVALVFLFKSR